MHSHYFNSRNWVSSSYKHKFLAGFNPKHVDLVFNPKHFIVIL